MIMTILQQVTGPVIVLNDDDGVKEAGRLPVNDTSAFNLVIGLLEGGTRSQVLYEHSTIVKLARAIVAYADSKGA